MNGQADRLPPSDVTPRRLHPITLVQRLILSLPGFVAVLLATYRSPDSANWVSLIVTALYAVVALPLIYFRYVRFRYWMTHDELVIQSGVITRQHRSIPLEKIQNVSVVQRLLPRLTATASVQVVTAGSQTAEGVLEFVSLKEARRIREIVRAYQRTSRRPGPGKTATGGETHLGARDLAYGDAIEATRGRAALTSDRTGAPAINWSAEDASDDQQNERIQLVSLGLGRVLLSGAFRFSLLYIAIIFSLLQFFQPDPEALTRWLLQQRYTAFIEAVRQAPAIAAAMAVASAALLSWISGILVNLNKFYRFKLWAETDKVTKRTGLLTVSERSIPRRKIQAVILRSNPLMQAYDWWIASVQTIGHDVSKQGHAVVAPFVRWQEFVDLREYLTDAESPTSFYPVSRRRAARLGTRYVAGVLVASGLLSLVWANWWLVLLSAPLLITLAWLQWHSHGYAVCARGLAIRRGVIKRQIWLIPYEKMQVFYTMQSIFQRRRDLKSVHIDTAGASTMSNATVFDLRTEDADALINDLYQRFIDHTS